jgi:hypothetical protein
MTILLIGLALFAAVLGLFYLKDARASHRLARLAYSEPVMRLTVVAAALRPADGDRRIIELTAHRTATFVKRRKGRRPARRRPNGPPRAWRCASP